MIKSICRYVSQGWSLFKENWQFFVVAMIFMVILSGYDIFFGYYGVMENNDTQSIVITVILQFIVTILNMGLIATCLDVVRGGDATYTRLFMGFVNIRLVVLFILGSLLYIVVVLTGLIILIIPGLIALVRIAFVQTLIVDTGCGPIDAVKQSFVLTRGHFWFIALFTGIIITIVIVSMMITFMLGLLIALPVVLLAFTSFYNDRYAAHTAIEKS